MWTVDRAPHLDLGERISPTRSTFFAHTGATRLTSGTIVVGDFMANVARLFDSTGRFLGNAGRGQDTLAEMRLLSYIRPCADGGFVVDDRSINRTYYFDDSGRYRKIVQTDPPLWAARLMSCGRKDRLTFEVHGRNFSGTSTGLVRVPLYVAQLDAEGGEVAGTQPSGTREMYRNDEFKAVIERPLANQTLFAAGPDLVFRTNADDSTLTVYSTDGRMIRSITHRLRTRPTTPDALGAVTDQVLLRRDRRGERDMYLMKKVPYRNTVPATRDMIADLHDNVWLRGWDGESKETSRWTMFDSTGSPARSVDLPNKFEVVEFGDDYALGFAWVEGTQHVQMYHFYKDTLRQLAQKPSPAPK